MINPHWASLQIRPGVRGTTNPNFLRFQTLCFFLFSHLKYDVNKLGLFVYQSPAEKEHLEEGGRGGGGGRYPG